MRDLILTTVPTVFLAVVTFFLTRRKYKAEVKQQNAQAETSEIDNTEKAIKIWREMTETLRTEFSYQIDILKNENQTIKSTLQTVENQHQDVVRENKNLREQMQSLEKELKLSKSQIKCLSDQNKTLLEELKRFNKNYEEPK